MRYSQTLRDIAPILAHHKHGPELLRILAEGERGHCDFGYCEVDGFDTAEAVHYVASQWHGGQWCPLYAAMCATEFHPGMAWRRPEDGFTAARMIKVLRGRATQ